MAYDAIISKYQLDYTGSPVTLSSPTLRYVRVSDGACRDHNTGDFGLDVSDSDAEHTLGEEIATAQGFGWTIPDDLPREKLMVILSDGGSRIGHGWLFDGRTYVEGAPGALTPNGRIAVEAGLYGL